VILLHELYYPLTFGKRLPVAIAHRLQAAALMSIADVCIVTTPARRRKLSRWLPWLARRLREIPVGSNIPVSDAGSDVVRSLRTELAGDGPLIGSFGTLGADGRNHALLFSTLARVLVPHPDLKFVWIGSVDCNCAAFRAVAEQARRHGVSDRIEWTGSLGPAAVSEHLSALDVFISLQDGGPCFRRGSLVAAMAHGLPIVALGGSGTDLRLEHGEHMLIVPRSAEAVSRAVEELLQSPDRRAKLARSATKFHDRYLDWGVLTDQLIEAAQSVAKT
jgi:glycosyltransferase involved in cell wall biosynthesis